MKKCNQCGLSKKIGEFYRLSKPRVGRFGKCKQCMLQHYKEVRETNGDAMRKRDSDRFQTKERKEKVKEYQARGRKKNRKKWRARSAFHHALRDGKIVRPSQCSMCNKKCKPDGHHHDYSKPLEVTWVCRQCHLGRIHHKTLPEIVRGHRRRD